MTKAVAKKEEAKLAQYSDLMDDVPVDATDILIPKLLLMQSMSELVKDEKARSGEIRDSIEGKLIAGKEESVEIIPFARYKTWVTMAKSGGKFVEQVPFTVANAGKPRQEIINGEEVLNFECLNYYCLLPSEIKAGAYMPYVVSFRSTSYMAGKTLETIRIKLQEFKKPLPFKTFNLSCKQRENDMGKFYVYTIAESRDTTEEELGAVKHWNDIVKQSSVKVDESEFSESEKSANSTADFKEDDRF